MGQTKKDKGTGGRSRMPKWGLDHEGGKTGDDGEVSYAMKKLEKIRRRLNKLQGIGRAKRRKGDTTLIMEREEKELWNRIRIAAKKWISQKQGGKKAKAPAWKIDEWENQGATGVDEQVLEEMDKQARRDKAGRIRRWKKRWKQDWKNGGRKCYAMVRKQRKWRITAVKTEEGGITVNPA
jgi:hypothetical protein